MKSNSGRRLARTREERLRTAAGEAASHRQMGPPRVWGWAVLTSSR